MQRYSPDKQSGLYFSKSKRENAGRKKMKAYERLLKYITVWTTSDENSTTVPTTKRQLDLGNLLVEEMKEMKNENVRLKNTVNHGGNGRCDAAWSDCASGYRTGL